MLATNEELPSQKISGKPVLLGAHWDPRLQKPMSTAGIPKHSASLWHAALLCWSGTVLLGEAAQLLKEISLSAAQARPARIAWVRELARK